MKVVKSTEVSKKLIDSNTNEITFKVIMEKSLVDDQQTAAFNKQSLLESLPKKVSIFGLARQYGRVRRAMQHR